MDSLNYNNNFGITKDQINRLSKYTNDFVGKKYTKYLETFVDAFSDGEINTEEEIFEFVENRAFHLLPDVYISFNTPTIESIIQHHTHKLDYIHYGPYSAFIINEKYLSKDKMKAMTEDYILYTTNNKIITAGIAYVTLYKIYESEHGDQGDDNGQTTRTQQNTEQITFPLGKLESSFAEVGNIILNVVRKQKELITAIFLQPKIG